MFIEYKQVNTITRYTNLTHHSPSLFLFDSVPVLEAWTRISPKPSGSQLPRPHQTLPTPGRCLADRWSWVPPGQLGPVSCLWSPTGHNGLIALLQLVGNPYCRCPPASSGVATTTGTNHLTATTPISRLNSRGAEHGPLDTMSPASPGTWEKLWVETPSWPHSAEILGLNPTWAFLCGADFSKTNE